jgi:hypothetical protein
MQQPERGATIFHLQVAPARAFSEKTCFLRHFGANIGFNRRKRTKNGLFYPSEISFRRVALWARKIRVAPGCTPIVLQANLAASLGHIRGQ